MQAKSGSKVMRLILQTEANLLQAILLFSCVFEVVMSSASNNFFWTLPPNNSQYSTEMMPQLPDIEN